MGEGGAVDDDVEGGRGGVGEADDVARLEAGEGRRAAAASGGSGRRRRPGTSLELAGEQLARRGRAGPARGPRPGPVRPRGPGAGAARRTAGTASSGSSRSLIRSSKCATTMTSAAPATWANCGLYSMPVTTGLESAIEAASE